MYHSLDKRTWFTIIFLPLKENLTLFQISLSFILIFDWISVNATLILRMNLSPYTNFCKEKRQNLNQIYQRNFLSLFDTSIMSRIVESKTVKSIVKVCKIVLFF